MRPDLFRHAPALPVFLPDGACLYLHPLPPATIERAWLDTELECKARGGGGDLILLGIVGARRILEAACGECVGHLYQAEVVALLARWHRWQVKCDPVRNGKGDHLVGWLRRRVNDDPDVLQDGGRAYNSKTAAAYYGVPQVDLTDGQVAYWLTLMNAYAEFHVPDGKGRRKQATKKWLRSDPREG